MIKIKQWLGMIFFICFYEFLSVHPFDAEIFLIFYSNNFRPVKFFQFYNSLNLFFYLAPIMLVVYIFSLLRYFKENSSLFGKIFAYLIISICVLVEMLDFLFKYNPYIFAELNIDWLSLFENLGGGIGGDTTNVDLVPFLVISITSILSNWLSLILLFIVLIMVIIAFIISYITFRKQIKTTTKISEEIKEHTNISKKFFFIKPMNLIFMKQRLKFFKEFDKKQIYSKDPSYFRGKMKLAKFCFSCGLFFLLIWLLVNLFLDPVATMYISAIGNVNIHYGFYSLWIILPFRILMSLSFGYGIFILLNIWKKFSTFLNIEFEQSLIRDQNPNGLGNDVDKDEFDKVYN